MVILKIDFIFWSNDLNEEVEENEDQDTLEEINENILTLNENVVALNETLTSEEDITEEEITEEEITEASSENASVSPSLDLISDNAVDEHLYLSGVPAEDASLNDLYAIALSTRNIVLLFFLFFCFFKFFGALKNLIYRIMNK